MDEERTENATNEETRFSRQVSAQAARKLKAQRGSTKSIWFGLGMSGLVGWSVTIPTLIGTALGIWIDKHYPSTCSWTLMLLLIGLIIGCFNAWHWVHSEYKEIQEDHHE
jgi:ATP synthase protein I